MHENGGISGFIQSNSTTPRGDLSVKKIGASFALLMMSVSAAHAQSSITLYGVVDPDIVFVNNAQTGRSGGQLTGKQQYSMMDATTSSYFGSRFGLKGVEDLGGGMTALFTLENGFNAANGTLGQGGLLFGRQAFVGLSAPAGRITLGRQYSSLWDFVSPLAVITQWAGYLGSHPDDLDNIGGTNRQNNSLKYTSPTWNGVTANALYSAGGVAGSFSENQIWSVGMGYTGGAVRLGIAFVDAFDPNTSLYGSTPTAGGADTNNLGSFGSETSAQRNPIIAGYASAHREQIFGMGGSYVAGPATLGLVYTNTRFAGLGSSSGPNPLSYSGSSTFNTVEANLQYQVTVPVSVGLAYSFTKDDGPNDQSARYQQVTAGVHYFFSKRTDVYMVAAYQRASGTNSLGQSAVASIAGMTPSARSQQVVDTIGLAHRF
ncbi:porin [Paraburkholderia sediminicola]|jgi:predicted porin|uniref:porin n=2 Tax=Paraburkholderia sediminicola TaxID=458836 RepID=UPI0038BDF3F0